MNAEPARPSPLRIAMHELTEAIEEYHAHPSDAAAARIISLAHLLFQKTESAVYNPTTLQEEASHLLRSWEEASQPPSPKISEVAETIFKINEEFANPDATFIDRLLDLYSMERSLESVLSKLISSKECGEITQVEYIEGIKALIPCDTTGVATQLKHLLSGPLASEIPSMIELCCETNPQEIISSIIKGETFGLAQEDLFEISLLYAERSPTEMIDHIHQLPLTLDQKLYILIHIIGKDHSQIPQKRINDQLDKLDLPLIHTQAPIPSSAFLGKILGKGLCFAYVRMRIEEALTKKPLTTPAILRYIQAAHLIHLSQCTLKQVVQAYSFATEEILRETLKSDLPSKIESTFKSFRVDSKRTIPLHSFPSVLLGMHHATQALSQQYAISLDLKTEGGGGTEGHELYLSLEKPFQFMDPNDVDPKTQEPLLHTFGSPSEAITAFYAYLGNNYSHRILSIDITRYTL